jgi:nicotinate (nicotinamide) nucleotide adenylyltransferase
MQFYRRAPRPPGRVGLLCGAFNPITTAHLALATEAAQVVDEVVLILPRQFPHKDISGASFEQRIEMILASLPACPEFSVAATSGGLFAQVAAECRTAYDPGTRFEFICGRDAAERFLNWDYGDPGAVAGMMSSFSLLVASRHGHLACPEQFEAAVRPLPLPKDFGSVSSTEVRRRIAAGERWHDLVPEGAHALAGTIYRAISPRG